MTPALAINAVNFIRPRIVYPYHYGDTDLTPIVDVFNEKRHHRHSPPPPAINTWGGCLL